MSRKKILHLSGCLFCMLGLQTFVFPQTAEQSSQTPSPEVSPLSRSAKPIEAESKDLIHIGDLIDVDVLGSTEYDWRGTLTPEGFLNGIEFVEEPVYALCRAEDEVARNIARGYSNLLKNPQVSVKIIDRSGRPVSFLYGAVKNPQRFKLNRPVYLNELIILSGGLTEKANGEIQILRSPNLNCQTTPVREKEAGDAPTETQLVAAKQEESASFINVKIVDLLKGNKQANPLILTGDVVTVLEAQPIYVTGGVASPKQINARSKMTITRAITSAGGLVKNADREKVIVFRRENNETKVIEVNLSKIEAGEEEDLELRAFDIVEAGAPGKEKRKFPPFVKTAESAEKSYAELPLRIID